MFETNAGNSKAETVPAVELTLIYCDEYAYDRWVKIKRFIYVTIIAFRIINVRGLTKNLLVYSENLSSFQLQWLHTSLTNLPLTGNYCSKDLYRTSQSFIRLKHCGTISL